MLIVHYHNSDPLRGEEDYGVYDEVTVYGTCADDDNVAISAVIHCLAELGSDDACVVAYERMDGYSPNVEDYEGCSYAVLAATYDPIRDRHEWWREEEVTEDLQLW